MSAARDADWPTLLMIGEGEPMEAALRLALDRRGLFVEKTTGALAVETVMAAAPDLVLLMGDATDDGGTAVLTALAGNPVCSVVPVALLLDDASLDHRFRAFRSGAVAVVVRSASADAMARRVAEIAKELPERAGEAAGELGETTLDELVKVITEELRSGILSVGPSSSEGEALRLVFGAGRPVADAVQSFVQRLRQLVAEAEAVPYELHEATGGRLLLLDLDESTVQGDGAQLAGMRILLLDHDPARADALATALRARGVAVAVTDGMGSGLDRARGIDPEVVLMDAAELEGRGFDVVRGLRRDPLLRWASLLVAQWDEIWPANAPTPDIGQLASRIVPLVQHDRALMLRATQKAPFDTRLELTGPSRTLRALTSAGGTLHATVRNPRATVNLNLADGLVVGATARGPESGATLQGTDAVATLLALGSGRVHVDHRGHPSVANVMLPVDEALDAAAKVVPPITPSIPPPSIVPPPGGSAQGAAMSSTGRPRTTSASAMTAQAASAGTGNGASGALADGATAGVGGPPANGAGGQATRIEVASTDGTAGGEAKGATDATVGGTANLQAAGRGAGAPVPPPPKAGLEIPRPPSKATALWMRATPAAPVAAPPPPAPGLPASPTGAASPGAVPAPPAPMVPASPATPPTAPSPDTATARPTAAEAATAAPEPPPPAKPVAPKPPPPRRALKQTLLGAAGAPVPRPATDDAETVRPPPSVLDELEAEEAALARSELEEAAAPAEVELSVAPSATEASSGDASDLAATPFEEAGTLLPGGAYETDLLKRMQEPTERTGAPAFTTEEISPSPAKPKRRGRGLLVALLSVVMLAVGGASLVFANPHLFDDTPLAPYLATLMHRPDTRRGAAPKTPRTHGTASPPHTGTKSPTGLAAGHTGAPAKPAHAEADAGTDAGTDAGASVQAGGNGSTAGAANTPDAGATNTPPREHDAGAGSAAGHGDQNPPATGNDSLLAVPSSMSPDHAADLLARRGHEVAAQGQLAEAERCYRRALELDRQNPHAADGLARVYLARHDAATALTWAERAVHLRHLRAPYQVLLGDVLEMKGDDAGARAAWHHALSLDPHNQDARKRLQ